MRPAAARCPLPHPACCNACFPTSPLPRKQAGRQVGDSVTCCLAFEQQRQNGYHWQGMCRSKGCAEGKRAGGMQGAASGRYLTLATKRNKTKLFANGRPVAVALTAPSACVVHVPVCMCAQWHRSASTPVEAYAPLRPSGICLAAPRPSSTSRVQSVIFSFATNSSAAASTLCTILVRRPR